MNNAKAIWKALPGTSLQISHRTHASIREVRKLLRDWRARGKVRRFPRWYGRHQGYTWVYEKSGDSPDDPEAKC